MRFAELFDEDSVVCGLKASDREGICQELLDSLVASRRISRAESIAAFEAVKKRERMGSTGIGCGVAIPHVKINNVSKLVATVGVHYDGVDYHAIDGEAVHIIFLVVRPDVDAREHLQFLQWVSKLGRSADFRRFMRSANSRSEIVSLLNEMSDM